MTAFSATSRHFFWVALLVTVTLLYCFLYDAGFFPFVELEV